MTDSLTDMSMRNRRSGSALREPDLNKSTSSNAPDDPQHDLLALPAFISTVYLTLLLTPKPNRFLNAALQSKQTAIFTRICYSKSLPWNKNGSTFRLFFFLLLNCILLNRQGLTED